jgi:cell division protein FtsB
VSRLLALILLAVLILLQVKLWVGAGGWREVEQLEETVARQAEENARLEQRNAALEAEVDDLKRGQAAVEERARAELGMIKPGEVFYRVVDPGTPPPPPKDEGP